MPRTARLLIDHGVYHVLTRGNNGQSIFHEPADFQRYLQLLAAEQADHGLRLYHFALMPNHVHLILEVPLAQTLSKAMLALNLTYALFYRNRYGYQGHLWQGRFKSLLIDRDDYLLECGRYVELNPVRAGIVQNPREYPWTSYRFYAEGVDNPLIDADPLYVSLGHTAESRQQHYQRFVHDGIRQPPLEPIAHRRFAGSPDFIKRMEGRFGVTAVIGHRGRPRKEVEVSYEK